MIHKFPPVELFPDDDLAPVTAESMRYVYQLRRVNRVVIGLRELDGSLGEKIGVATGLLVPVTAKLAETYEALEKNTTELAEQRARQEALIETVKALEARLPDPKRVRHEIQGDLWQVMEPQVVQLVADLGVALGAQAREAGARLAEASQRGYMAPAQPEEGSPLWDRLRYRKERIAYRLKNFAADWLAVTQLVGVAALTVIAFCQFVFITHRPL
ncbi:hypothetical protein [Paraburkholderia tuberum]|uniref:Uncharacterized protein n=1 Tax=Paraburkholderia tuberum TaxID=157910 RepID=A0A1H1KFV6_9BURK|nr:hypothetical protein [Paraburkholderia tuberum]SDR60952.1 hypothetical protein SAMN05445850_7463 [Paraburkholderia tuberum]